MMVSVTKNNQITIPKEMREDLDIHPGDKVVFVKDKGKKWVLMKVGVLTDKMIEASSDIEETIEESRKGFKNGVKRSIQSLGGKD
jgi:AbrB family looped-hinge helix DNA binding protein